MRNYLRFCSLSAGKMLIMMVKMFSGHQHTLAKFIATAKLAH